MNHISFSHLNNDINNTPHYFQRA